MTHLLTGSAFLDLASSIIYLRVELEVWGHSSQSFWALASRPCSRDHSHSVWAMPAHLATVSLSPPDPHLLVPRPFPPSLSLHPPLSPPSSSLACLVLPPPSQSSQCLSSLLPLPPLSILQCIYFMDNSLVPIIFRLEIPSKHSFRKPHLSSLQSIQTGPTSPKSKVNALSHLFFAHMVCIC